MPVPAQQAAAIGWYIARQKLRRREQFALMLFLEPLYQCNLECVGCGKIQHPDHILRRRMTVEQALGAADECGAPVVNIAGGEPLIHKEIHEIAAGLVERKRFVYFCSNALLMERRIGDFEPSKYLTFNVHVDALRDRHDELVARSGTFDKAIAAIKQYKEAGFRVCTNTTIFLGTSAADVRDLFDYLTAVGVDAMTVSPGYAYEKAPDQEHFLKREQTRELFRQILGDSRQRGWPLGNSQTYLNFLQGQHDFQCTPWGGPTYTVFGWQKPCYLMSDGYAQSFQELLDDTPWEQYGHGNDPRCGQCMVHSGYEPTAVLASTKSLTLGLRELRSSVLPAHARAS